MAGLCLQPAPAHATCEGLQHAAVLLNASELIPIDPKIIDSLFHGTFQMNTGDTGILIMTDEPPQGVAKNAEGLETNIVAESIARHTAQRISGMPVHIGKYLRTETNNGELPENIQIFDARTGELIGVKKIVDMLHSHSIVLGISEHSSTAPLKDAAEKKKFPFRGATMPGFARQMLPTLMTDFVEVTRMNGILKKLLDPAIGADVEFETPDGQTHKLFVDLRNREAITSDGVIGELNAVKNMPGGEAYIVPYEGEIAGDPSKTSGVLPLELGGEIVLVEIRTNKAVRVLTDGAQSRILASKFRAEPAFANIAELGFGVLKRMGVKPVPGSILINEKLGFHIAFGRSNHFKGGTVGPQHFSHPSRSEHLDHVFVEEMQPSIRVKSVRLRYESQPSIEVIRNDDYVPGLF